MKFKNTDLRLFIAAGAVVLAPLVVGVLRPRAADASVQCAYAGPNAISVPLQGRDGKLFEITFVPELRHAPHISASSVRAVLLDALPAVIRETDGGTVINSYGAGLETAARTLGAEINAGLRQSLPGAELTALLVNHARSGPARRPVCRRLPVDPSYMGE